MDFSKKLSRVAAASTWVGIVLAVVGAIVLHHHPPPGVHVHLRALYCWEAARRRQRVVHDRAAVRCSEQSRTSATASPSIGIALLLSTTLSVSAAVAVSGGLRGPFWILYLPALLFAATTLKQWQAVLLGVGDLRRPRRRRTHRAQRRLDDRRLAGPGAARVPGAHLVQQRALAVDLGDAGDGARRTRRAASAGRRAVHRSWRRRPRATCRCSMADADADHEALECCPARSPTR